MQKGKSEAVNQRRTDNTMAKTKQNKKDRQNTTQKQKVEQHELTKERGINSLFQSYIRYGVMSGKLSLILKLNKISVN